MQKSQDVISNWFDSLLCVQLWLFKKYPHLSSFFLMSGLIPVVALLI